MILSSTLIELRELMKLARRKWLSLVLVAGYGCVSVLGYGLHWFVPQHGHHHGLQVVCTGHHDDRHAHHHHAHGDVAHHHHSHAHHGLKSDSPQEQTVVTLTASGCGSHSHLCEICAYLFQARAERAQLASAEVSLAFVVAGLPAPTEPLSSATPLGPHSPRGPPSHAS